MDTLALHISQLLWRVGSVPVPGIGVFSTRLTTASLVDNQLLPPEYSVSFMPDAYCSAAPLEQSYMRATGADSATAALAVGNAVSDLRSALDMGATFPIPGAGTLRKDAAGALAFDADTRLRVGSPLAASAAEKTTVTDDQVAQVAAALAERRDTLARAVRRTAQSAAAIVMFALLAFVVSQLPSRQAMPRQTASMGTVHVSAYADAPVEFEQPQFTPVLVLRTPSDGCVETQTHAQRAAERLKAQAFCLVVGSLASEAEAKLFIEQHNTPEVPLKLIHSEGRWRVYTVTGESIAAAIAEGHRQGIFDVYPEAWVCRR